MKRSWIAAAVLAGASFFCLAGAQKAQAAVEFCPATVAGSSGPGGAQIYAYRLQAEGTRSVTGEVAIQTDAGWYAAAFKDVALANHASRYDTDEGTYRLTQAVSPLLYVRFPKPVRVTGLWVRRASATGDREFGWDARGTIACAPQVYRPAGESAPSAGADRLHDEDRLPYDAAPSPKDAVATANPIPPEAPAACAVPFVDAWTSDVAAPHYPHSIGTVGAVVMIRVAISSEGHLLDAWVAGNSGLSSFEPYALAAAQQTTYHNAVAYCRPVPSVYSFRVEFTPSQ